MSSCCGSICSSRSRPGDEAPTAGPTRPGRETAHDRLGRSGRDRSAAGGERPVRPAAVAGGGPAADAHPTPGGRPAAGRDGRLAAGSRSAEPGPGVVPQRPRLLSGAYGEVCQRCLAASSPFAAGHTVQTGLPVALLMLLPALGATLLLGRLLHHLLASHRQARSLSARIVGSARRTRVAGHEVWLLRDARPLAFALPRSKGGIVISDGLRGQLADRELTAVLAHEQRSEEHTSELQSRGHLVCRLLLEKKK